MLSNFGAKHILRNIENYIFSGVDSNELKQKVANLRKLCTLKMSQFQTKQLNMMCCADNQLIKPDFNQRKSHFR